MKVNTNSLFRRCNHTWEHKTNGALPCGKCPACRKRFTDEWTTRGILEDKSAINAWFVTLTYNDLNLPYVVKIGPLYTEGKQRYYQPWKHPVATGYVLIPVVKKKDVQKWLDRLFHQEKRFRKKRPSIIDEYQPRYLLMSEYGTEGNRPHYHAVIWNVNKKVIEDTHNSWNKGWVKIETPRKVGSTVGYCTKYLMKMDDYRNHTVKPFKMQSQNLGLSYILNHKEKVKSGLILMDGYMIPLPKNWRKHFYSSAQWRLIRTVSEIQLENEQNLAMEFLLDYFEECHITVHNHIKERRDTYAITEKKKKAILEHK